MASATHLITNVRVFDGEYSQTTDWFAWDGAAAWWGTGTEPPDADITINGNGGFVSPPLFDTHVHGGGGFAADAGLVSMEKSLDFHQQNGTGPSFLSLLTDSPKRLVQLLKDARKISSPLFRGVHLEGPFISPKYPGCHAREKILTPTLKNLDFFLSAGTGSLASMTVAAELLPPGALPLISSHEVTICLGHTSASYDQAREAFDNGVRVLTHAFNGMPGIEHRAPGPVVAALDAGVYTELIADGTHVHPPAARLLDPAKVILVTDAISAAGQNDGSFRVGREPVTVTDGVARTSSGSLAGSTLLLSDAVHNYAQWTSSAELALRAAITNPLQAYGVVAQGFAAGALLWDERCQLIQVLRA